MLHITRNGEEFTNAWRETRHTVRVNDQIIARGYRKGVIEGVMLGLALAGVEGHMEFVTESVIHADSRRDEVQVDGVTETHGVMEGGLRRKRQIGE